MLVTLNGNKYHVDRVRQFPVNPLAGAFRTTGVQQRSDNVKLNRFVFDDWWETGLGRNRIRRHKADDSGRASSGIRDADAETRFQSGITLPLKAQSETHADPLDHLIGYEHFKGNLYGLFEEDYDSTSNHRHGLHFSPYGASNDTWAAANIAHPGNSSDGESSGGATSLTVSHSIQTAFGNRAVFAIVGSTGTADPTGVTYDGQAMTKFSSATRDGSSDVTITIWHKVNPNSGTVNCVASFGSSVTSSMMILDAWNVNQTTPLAFTTLADDGAGTSSSVAVAGRLGDLNIGAAATASSATVALGSGQVSIGDEEQSGFSMRASYERNNGSDPAFTASWSGSADFVSLVSTIQANYAVTYTEANSEGIRGFGTAVHKGKAYVLGSYGIEETQYSVWSSADGLNWDTANGTNWPTTAYLTTTVTRRNLFTDKLADVMSFGNNIIVALYEDPDSSGGSISQVRIGYSANAGTAWTFNAGLVIPCTDTPNVKLLSFRDVFSTNSNIAPALVTSDNVYILDITNNTFAELLEESILGGTSGEALAASVATDGNLYISKETGDILQVAVPSPGVINIKNVGPASKTHGEVGDGLVSGRQGYATSMVGTDPTWLFVTYGGNASGKYASILAMEFSTLSWHSMFLDSTADRDCYRIVLSNEDDGTMRLHGATEAAGESVMFMFENPLLPPSSGVTLTYDTTGYIEWAEDDLADPHTNAAVMKALIDDGGSIGDGTTKNYVAVKYGVDGAAWDATTLGNFLDSALTLNFDTSNNRGISAKTLRVRLELHQQDDSTTTTPDIREFEIQARNRVNVLRGWELDIDLDKSAEYQSTEQPANAETVVTNLTTIQDSVTLVGMTIGEASEVQVEMTSGEWQLQLIDAGGGDGLQSGRVSGRAVVVLEEVQ
jgi:hypothetical protein